MKILILTIMIFFGSLAIAQDAPEVIEQPSAMVEGEIAEADPQVIEQPPEWLVKSLEIIYAIPVIGPIAAKVMQWLGVLAVILTSLCGFLMLSLKALMTVANWMQLLKMLTWLQAFEKGKVMYYLRMLSLFNAPPKKV